MASGVEPGSTLGETTIANSATLAVQSATRLTEEGPGHVATIELPHREQVEGREHQPESPQLLCLTRLSQGSMGLPPFRSILSCGCSLAVGAIQPVL
jgi:hypothetical protein